MIGLTEPNLLQTPAILFCDVDGLVPVRGKMVLGFDEFSAALDHAGIPMVWVTSRTRLQIDDPRRKLGHTHPFIAEGGCGAYLPEGYFHLRPAETLRLGRFTCLPIAEPQPAAAEALEELSEETSISTVALSSLSPRELAQNAGLPAQQAELTRHRDFDELFFFAGTPEDEAQRFAAEARNRGWQLRERGVLRSLAIGASMKKCVRELSKLYTRALRFQPKLVGIAAEWSDSEILTACDRGFLLVANSGSAAVPIPPRGRNAHIREVDISAPDCWERILEAMTSKQ
jgi:mannosyl-3-phosphoglycerate phosphatase